MEEGSDPPEEPDQRRQERHTPGLPHEEQIRLVFLGLALLALLVDFLLDRFTGAILPLFATMVVAYVGYRRLDATFGPFARISPSSASLSSTLGSGLPTVSNRYASGRLSVSVGDVSVSP